MKLTTTPQQSTGSRTCGEREKEKGTEHKVGRESESMKRRGSKKREREREAETKRE